MCRRQLKKYRRMSTYDKENIIRYVEGELSPEETLAMGKPYLYLGFWVKGSPKMTYKEKFQPLELYVNEQWIDYADYNAPPPTTPAQQQE